MPENKKISDQAIENILKEIQKLADKEKVNAPKRIAAQEKMENLVNVLAETEMENVSNVTADMVAAYLVFSQTIKLKAMQGDYTAEMDMARFSQKFLDNYNNYMKKIQADPQKKSEITQAAQELQKDLAPSMLPINKPILNIAIDAPEGDYGEWHMAVVPIVIDEDFNAKVAETLNYDFYISMEITPHEGLSGKFNIPAQFTKAGDKYEPLTISTTVKPGDTPKILHVSGHQYENGRLMNDIVFPKAVLRKQNQATPEFAPFEVKKLPPPKR
ncbi:MAG: hypothetical protein CO093_09665 [Alphaproteobacteria bacterium CG_4_9_14_3_um_filter_47_13]|nr:MAG: hypothetical protein CO093_09665 [Alphaproteobacteria bacterium CG_4_9_14_3_um_filter_47_13]